MIKIVFFIFIMLLYSNITFGLDASKHFKISDGDFFKRDQSGYLEKSIETLDMIHKELENLNNNEKYTLYWKLAQRYSIIPMYTTWEKDNTITKMNHIYELTKKIEKINPEGKEGLYWRAILLARVGELQGVLNSLFLIPTVYNQMEKIIKIDPNYHRAYFIKAKLHRKAPPLISVGNIKEAQKNIEIARKLDPTESYYLLEEAEILLAQNKKIEAKKSLQILIDLTYQKKYYKDTVNRNKIKAKELLKKI